LNGSLVFHAPTAEDTHRLGEALGRTARPGDALLLTGPLGAGKTTLVQGLAAGLGVRQGVTSPTFTWVREHSIHFATGRTGRLVHVDLYRLQEPGESVELGIAEEVAEADVAAVEWADRAPAGVLPGDALAIALGAKGTGRLATIEARGPRAAAWLARTREELEVAMGSRGEPAGS
jgi:tRNA threonylcarbamoyladenosine biosynthesis protein TsaE